jgi:hypothetical protein
MEERPFHWQRFAIKDSLKQKQPLRILNFTYKHCKEDQLNWSQLSSWIAEIRREGTDIIGAPPQTLKQHQGATLQESH